MPKRKRHPKLPSGWGSIKYLGKGRRNCYAVHPPATECRENGSYIQPKALCYVDDWYVGFAMLNAWHNGKYTPGDEKQYKAYQPTNPEALDELCSKILNDHQAFANEHGTEHLPTFTEVYEQFYEYKFRDNAPVKLSESSRSSIKAAYGNCGQIHQRVFSELKLDDLQAVLDGCTLKKASLELIVTLFRQMYKYAMPRELCEKDYSAYLRLPDAEDDEHGVPFTDDELKKIWKAKDDTTARQILIMCYSGFRIKAYGSAEVNTEEWYFKGGIKTKAGKGRIVPIHSAIQNLVTGSIPCDDIFKGKGSQFREKMYKFLDSIGIEKHTPHDCRHTFSALCEKYDVNENDRKRMLGHSFGKDITNSVYGHRTLEELRTEIEKIQVPDL